MGLTPFQVLTRVELPLALPLVFAGVRTAAVYVVATATLAGVVGGGSLGDIIFNQATYFLSGSWARPSSSRFSRPRRFSCLRDCSACSPLVACAMLKRRTWARSPATA